VAIVPTLKDARGYERSGYPGFQEMSQGVRPTLGPAARPANWLPALLEDRKNNEWFTILAGTIMAMNRSISGTSLLVPANGNAAMTVTYSTNDVGYTPDIDSVVAGDVAYVAAAGDATQTIPANKPIGWAWTNMYTGGMADRLVNFTIQPRVSILCDYEIELALRDGTRAGALQNFEGGDLVKPGLWGNLGGVPHLWVNGVDSAEQICGRVLLRDTIPTGVNSRGRIDLVKPVRLGLSGRESDGRPRHLDAYMLGSIVEKATDFIRVNIMM